MMIVVYQAKSHHLYRQNFYRFNTARGYWEFNDHVGPWAPSGWMTGMNEEQGKEALDDNGWVLRPTQGT